MAHGESVDVPDEVLVVAAMLGDLSAFDDLCARYRAAVVRMAQGIVGRADAEDVAQDALLIAFKALPTLEAPAKFAAWLAAITRHRAFRFTRQERAHQRGRVELDEALLAGLATLSKPLVEQADKAELRQVCAVGVAMRGRVQVRACVSDHLDLADVKLRACGIDGARSFAR